MTSPASPRLLVVAATELEINGLRDRLAGSSRGIRLDYLVTGVGPVATAIALTERLLTHRPDLVLDIGIAGSLRSDVPPPTVVSVTRDRLADLGAEDRDGGYLSLADLGLEDWSSALSTDGYLPATHPGLGRALPETMAALCTAAEYLPQVTGVTLARAQGSARTIARFRKRFPEAEVESMEGAAVFLAAARRHVAAVQIRAISNFVGPRDRDSWLIGPALRALWETVAELLLATADAGAVAPPRPSR